MRESTKYLYSAKHTVLLQAKHRRAENYVNYAWEREVCVREKSLRLLDKQYAILEKNAEVSTSKFKQ